MKLRTLGLTLSIAFLASNSSNAQTLFKYGKHKVSKDEFIQAYQKNNNTEAPYQLESVENYIDLYSLFKMRLQEGYEQKIDQTPKFKEEYQDYEEQLTNNFVYNKIIEEQLVSEVLKRAPEDRKFAHILLPIHNPKDSLEVLQNISSIYHDLKAEKISFEDAARRNSKDNSSARSGGVVGYITPLNIVYEVENAVYNTEVGEISAPFVSPFGFHIVKVLDKRPAVGKVKVAQILISKEEGRALAENVLEQLKQGAKFEELVSLYSKDAFTNTKGGEMEAFGVGQMDINFENAAFALSKPGDISNVIGTDFGYHIIKLIEKQPFKIDEDFNRFVKSQIHRTGRTRSLKDQIYKQVLASYNLEENPSIIMDFRQVFMLDKENKMEVDKYKDRFNQTMFNLDGKKHTVKDFLDYMHEKTNGIVLGSRMSFYDQMYRSYLEDNITILETRRLKKEDKEYISLLEEYKNGMLIFNVMEQNIWNKGITDYATLEKFYNDHKNKYEFGPGFEGIVYTAEAKLYLEQLKEQLLNGIEFQQALNNIDAGRGIVKFKNEEAKFNYADYGQFSPKNLDKNTFSHILPIEGGHYQMIFIKQHIPNKSHYHFEDVKGQVSVDYQRDIEEKWNETLKKKYPVKVNKRTLKSIVK